MAAVGAGVRHVQATINGYGERAGNANMVSHPGQPRPQDRARARAGGRRRPGRPDRARRARSPRSPTSPRTTTSRTSAARRSPTRAASTAPRWPRSSGATSTSIRPLVGNAGPARRQRARRPRRTPRIRAEQLGPRARRRRRSARGPVELDQAARERTGLAFEGAEASFELLIRRHADATTPRRSGSSTTPASSSSAPGARAARRGDRQGRGRRRGAPHRRRRQRPGQRARRRAAQGAPGVLPAASTTSTWCDYKVRILDGDAATAARTRVDHRLDGRRSRPGRRWAATRTSSRPRRRPSPTRSSTRSGRPAPSSRRRDERHFTTDRPAATPPTGAPPVTRPRPHGGSRMTAEADQGPVKDDQGRTPEHPSLHLARWTVTSGSNVRSRGAVVIDLRRAPVAMPRPRATARSTRCTGPSTRRCTEVLDGPPATAGLRHPRARRGTDTIGARDGPDRAAETRRRARRAATTAARRAATNIIAASIEAYVEAHSTRCSRRRTGRARPRPPATAKRVADIGRLPPREQRAAIGRGRRPARHQRLVRV